MLGMLIGGALRSSAPSRISTSPLSGLLASQRTRSGGGGMGGIADEADGQQRQVEQEPQKEPLQEMGATAPAAPMAPPPSPEPQPLVRKVAEDLKAQQPKEVPPVGGPVTSELLAEGPVVREPDKGTEPVAPAPTAINQGEEPTPTVTPADEQFPNVPQVQPQEDAPDQISELPQRTMFEAPEGMPTQPLSFQFSEAPMMPKSYGQSQGSPSSYVPQFQYARR